MIEFDPERRTVDIAITRHDFDASLNFYRNILGFEVVIDTQISTEIAAGIGLASSGFRQVRLQAGETLIKLMDIEPPPLEASHAFASGVRWLTIYVEDIERVVADLKKKGAEFRADPVIGKHATAVIAVAPDGLFVEFARVHTKRGDR